MRVFFFFCIQARVLIVAIKEHYAAFLSVINSTTQVLISLSLVQPQPDNVSSVVDHFVRSM